MKSGPGTLALAPRQLVAQGRERLVRGERARRSVLVAAVAGRRRTAAAAGPPGFAVLAATLAVLGLFLGLARLRDLAAVRLEAGPRLGVLALPLLALRVVPFQPLARVRVETLRVDVVALVVIGGGHAVQGRVEVVADRLADRALVRLLEGQADPAPVEIDVDDLDEDLVAHLDDLLGDLHVPVGQLGDVHQALDALLDPDERAERDELGDPAWHDLPDLVGPGELLPRV